MHFDNLLFRIKPIYADRLNYQELLPDTKLIQTYCIILANTTHNCNTKIALKHLNGGRLDFQ